jgi:regulator of protease activity HflC (stomatin/prohibitin superfamily)
MLRTRLNVIAERLRQQADQAAAHYAENPTDQTETHAVKMAKKADQAAARVNAHAGTDPTRRRLMVALLDKFRETGTDQVYCSTLETGRTRKHVTPYRHHDAGRARRLVCRLREGREAGGAVPAVARTSQSSGFRA